jgi:uncharacterized protein YcfJ
MKKGLLLIVGGALLLSSCTTYTATGTYTGAQFGHVIGSAIGGISGGWRGHEIGSLIGTVGGAVVGAAIGSAADRAHDEKVQARVEQRNRERQANTRRRSQQKNNYGYDDYGYQQGGSDQSGYDPQGRGDDRITFAPATSDLEIRNAGVYEKVRDGVLTRGEECTVVFEIFNTTDHAVYDVYPLVEDATGNKHVKVSPNLRVESIAPHQGIRYTASILADSRLKDGEIQLMVGVAQGKQVLESQTRMFTIPTAKVAR